MEQKLTIIERIKSDTPLFFIKVRTVALSLAGIATTLIGVHTQVPDFVLPDLLQTICKYAIVAGIVAAGVSSTAVAKPTNI